MPDVPFSKDVLTDTFDQIVKSEITSRNYSFSNELFSTNHVSQCNRRIMYRSRGDIKATESMKNYGDRVLHHALVGKWVDVTRDCCKINVLGCFIQVSDCNYNLGGYVDVLFKIGQVEVALIIKSVSNDEFLRVSKSPFKKDVIEAMSIMWLAEKKHGMILYDNLFNNDFCTFHVVPYQPILLSVMSKYKNLLDCKIRGIIPERSYDNSESTECSECEYKDFCWSN